MKNIVSFNHALADETRWRMVQLIFSEPMCVCELADILDMPQSSVSSHMQVIKKSGMVDSEKREKWIYYRLSPSYRPLLKTLAHFFGSSPTSDAVLKADATRAALRLKARDESCCPRPKDLKKLKPLTGKSTSLTQPKKR